MNPPTRINRRQALRVEAETMLASLAPSETAASSNELLLHELLVHKVELEMQNEELRRAYTAMEEARDRYVGLYDLAPVGYFTLDRECLIGEVNLTGAALLGVDRHQLVNRPFSNFVSAQDKERWARQFAGLMTHNASDRHTFNLEVRRDDGSIFPAGIVCQCRDSALAAPNLNMALIDLSQR